MWKITITVLESMYLHLVFLLNMFLLQSLIFSILVNISIYLYFFIRCCLSSPPCRLLIFSIYSTVSTPTGWPLLLRYAVILGIHSASVSSPTLHKSEWKTGCIIHELQAGRQRSTWHPFHCDEPGRLLLILLKHAQCRQRGEERWDAAEELRGRAFEELRVRASREEACLLKYSGKYNSKWRWVHGSVCVYVCTCIYRCIFILYSLYFVFCTCAVHTGGHTCACIYAWKGDRQLGVRVQANPA